MPRSDKAFVVSQYPGFSTLTQVVCVFELKLPITMWDLPSRRYAVSAARSDAVPFTMSLTGGVRSTTTRASSNIDTRAHTGEKP